MKWWKVEAEVFAETEEKARILAAARLLEDITAQEVGWAKVEEKA